MRWSLSTRGKCCGSDRLSLSPCSNLGVFAAAEPLPVVAPHRPHLASDETPGWFLGDDLSALETLAGLDACAASAGVAMVLLSNSVPMNNVVRFIDPPHCSLNSVALDRELLSPSRAGTGGRFDHPEKQKEMRAGEAPRGHPGRSLAASGGCRCFVILMSPRRGYRYIRWSLAE